MELRFVIILSHFHCSPPGGAAAASSFVPNPDGLAMLEAMGMPTKKCVKALKETDNNVERAVDWIFR